MRPILFLVAFGLIIRGAGAEFEPLTPEAQQRLEARVSKIEGEVAEIRGLPFKRSIGVEHQSLDDFEKYLDSELARQIPDEKNEVYPLVLRKVGLYRGPLIEDFRSSVKRVMTSQAGAYYDPSTGKFYVLMTRMSDIMMGTLYAHELYHGLQDQHFDLNDYLMNQMTRLNEDEILARQSVVEGEATLMMTLWMMKSMGGGLPDPAMLDVAIQSQTQLDTDSMKGMLKSGMLNSAEMGDMAEAAKAMEELPRFMIETLVGAYLKGMGFVYQIYKEGGWEAVAQLYTERPPASSEQILHPEKWQADEKPSKIEWPDLETEAVLDGWTLLDQNTLGEIQLRIVLEEFGLKNRAKAVAEGWSGDRYAVLREENGENLMLLLFTAWDSEGDAMQFELAYRDLLATKYPGKEAVWSVLALDDSVFVVEAPPGSDLGALESLAAKVRVTP